MYQAVSHESVFAMHQHPNQDCLIGGHIQGTLGNVFNDAQAALEQALDKFTVATVLDETLRANAQTLLQMTDTGR